MVAQTVALMIVRRTLGYWGAVRHRARMRWIAHLETDLRMGPRALHGCSRLCGRVGGGMDCMGRLIADTGLNDE